MPGPIDERRRHPELRELFVQACEIIRPFFESTNQWAGRPHELLAHHALHEKYPQLSAQDLLIVITAAKRVFADRTKPAPH